MSALKPSVKRMKKKMLQSQSHTDQPAETLQLLSHQTIVQVIYSCIFLQQVDDTNAIGKLCMQEISQAGCKHCICTIALAERKQHFTAEAKKSNRPLMP